jgi:hypothetical protein
MVLHTIFFVRPHFRRLDDEKVFADPEQIFLGGEIEGVDL